MLRKLEESDLIQKLRIQMDRGVRGSVGWINETSGEIWRWAPGAPVSCRGLACYNLGGMEPTVTDADVILGYMNPDFYMGGKFN